MERKGTHARRRAIEGCLLGTALGDALGLPFENLSPQRANRIFGQPNRFCFVFGRGMISDDTEHACMAAQALIAAADDDAEFGRQLASRLRRWLVLLPAGSGLATARATIKLLIGVPPDRCGVFSAGNGPAMRSPILGAAIDNVDVLKRFVRKSTRMTHTDPKAEYGALGVALAARFASQHAPVEPTRFAHALTDLLADQPAEEFLKLVRRAVDSADRNEPATAFAQSLGLGRGVSGYIYHTVPVVLQSWLRNQHDFRAAVREVIACGGDTDTTAAIVGGIVGAGVGQDGLPAEWLSRLWEWPRSAEWISGLAPSCMPRGRPVCPAALRRCPYGALCRATCCSWQSSWFTASGVCCRPIETKEETQADGSRCLPRRSCPFARDASRSAALRRRCAWARRFVRRRFAA